MCVFSFSFSFGFITTFVEWELDLFVDSLFTVCAASDEEGRKSSGGRGRKERGRGEKSIKSRPADPR
jgi:hypothetical protein